MDTLTPGSRKDVTCTVGIMAVGTFSFVVIHDSEVCVSELLMVVRDDTCLARQSDEGKLRHR
jgi:hypothetical protein